jgi:ATP-dependent RNA helicase SUPV3L1/SUV3
MQNAAITQFKLGDDGLVRFQPDATNPTPGEPFARAVKGANILEPSVEVLDAGGQDPAAVKTFLETWLKTHIRTVLEPLTALEQTDALAEPVQGISKKLHEALGVVPREELEAFTTKLDPDMRQVLRGKQVKLGPVLVFLPALNKPAGVRLRGLLWSLWNDKPLPPPLPHDGVVSIKVDESADKNFYRAIGYPVYGPRAIRIDMLDRVINAVYDSAKDGKFQAQHKMAEWLGCQIDDLYGVLTAMGHRKVNDPLDAKPEEKKEEAPAAEAAPAAEEKPAETAEAKPEEKKAEKPELATFQLKKGKAFQKERPPREQGERKPYQGKPKDSKDSKDGKSRPKHKHKGKRDEKRPERQPRVISAEAKSNPDDSPFAILQQLKKAKGDGN